MVVQVTNNAMVKHVYMAYAYTQTVRLALKRRNTHVLRGSALCHQVQRLVLVLELLPLPFALVLCSAQDKTAQ